MFAAGWTKFFSQSPAQAQPHEMTLRCTCTRRAARLLTTARRHRTYYRPDRSEADGTTATGHRRGTTGQYRSTTCSMCHLNSLWVVQLITPRVSCARGDGPFLGAIPGELATCFWVHLHSCFDFDFDVDLPTGRGMTILRPIAMRPCMCASTQVLITRKKCGKDMSFSWSNDKIS